VIFNTDLTQIVDVLKGIAASRFHILERQLSVFETYFKVAGEFFSTIDFSQVNHPFVRPQSDRTGVLMVTSDAGFLGGLNARVVNVGLREGGAQGLLTVIGDRGVNYLRDVRQDFTAFPGVNDSNRRAFAFTVRNHLVSQVLSGACGRLLVVYPKPVSFAVQEVTVETLLPCTAWDSPERREKSAVNILWESRVEGVVEYVVTEWLGHRLDQILALSRLAELAARVVHLEGSYQELLRLGKKLKLQYFRARHEVIDRSMREIYASQLFCGKSDADDGS